MPNVIVPVLKPLTYQGRSYVRGQTVSMAPVDALAAARAGTVSLSKGAQTYGTRMMTAETPVSEPAAPAASTRRSRRRGRGTDQRRDLHQDPTT